MSRDLFDLTGRIALITGASRGIGEAIAHELAARGAHVIVSSRKVEDCQLVVDAIEDHGASAEALACHVGQLASITEAFQHVRDRHGRLDILVNNAAANPYFGPILETDPGAFEKTVDVNLRGSFFMSVESGRLMKETGGGVILNTGSVNGLRPMEFQGIYSITKSALIGMTKAFARELGPHGIRVNALLPGLTRTKFAGALFDNETLYQQFIRATPLRRHAEPGDMVGTALYLVSDASSYTSGECVVVDGGLTI